MTETLLTILKLSVGALILAIGMGSTFSDLAYLWRRPGLLLRSLLAMYVLFPLAAFLLVTLLPLAPGVKAALLVLAVSAGAPLLPRKLGGFGSDAYVFSLVVTSSLLAIVVVPAWVALLAHHFGVATELAPAEVAAAFAKAFLAPLATGMVIRALVPTFSAQVADRLLAIAGVVLTVTGLVLLVAVDGIGVLGGHALDPPSPSGCGCAPELRAPGRSSRHGCASRFPRSRMSSR